MPNSVHGLSPLKSHQVAIVSMFILDEKLSLEKLPVLTVSDRGDTTRSQCRGSRWKRCLASPSLGEGGVCLGPPLCLYTQLLSSCDSAVLTEESNEAVSQLRWAEPWAEDSMQGL